MIYIPKEEDYVYVFNYRTSSYDMSVWRVDSIRKKNFLYPDKMDTGVLLVRDEGVYLMKLVIDYIHRIDCNKRIMYIYGVMSWVMGL